MHAIITCYVLLLYYPPVVMVIMYRGVITVGVVVTRAMGADNCLVSANAIDDYSHVNARDSAPYSGQIARCVTGLGPSNGNDNGDIGSVSFNGTNLPFDICRGITPDVQPRGATNLNTGVGVINIGQCRALTTTAEGIYTCTMINSSMVYQSVRFGVYFTGRSESLIIYASHHLIIFHLSTQLLQ